jgi:hypothetical protein
LDADDEDMAQTALVVWLATTVPKKERRRSIRFIHDLSSFVLMLWPKMKIVVTVNIIMID